VATVRFVGGPYGGLSMQVDDRRAQEQLDRYAEFRTLWPRGRYVILQTAGGPLGMRLEAHWTDDTT
jgi:hypothetical protein